MFKNNKIDIKFSHLLAIQTQKIHFKRFYFNKIAHKNFCNSNKNGDYKIGKFSLKNLKHQLKEYGSLGLTVYLCLYVPSLITFYYLFKSKTLDPIKVVEFLHRNGAESFIDVEYMKRLVNSEGATLAFALICNRLSLVFRLPLTLYLTILIKKLMKK